MHVILCVTFVFNELMCNTNNDPLKWSDSTKAEMFIYSQAVKLSCKLFNEV